VGAAGSPARRRVWERGQFKGRLDPRGRRERRRGNGKKKARTEQRNWEAKCKKGEGWGKSALVVGVQGEARKKKKESPEGSAKKRKGVFFDSAKHLLIKRSPRRSTRWEQKRNKRKTRCRNGAREGGRPSTIRVKKGQKDGAVVTKRV